jgi:hypothetical protein
MKAVELEYLKGGGRRLGISPAIQLVKIVQVRQHSGQSLLSPVGDHPNTRTDQIRDGSPTRGRRYPSCKDRVFRNLGCW